MKTGVKVLRAIFSNGYTKAYVFKLNPTYLFQENNCFLIEHLVLVLVMEKRSDTQTRSVLIEGILVRQGAFRSPDFLITVYLCFCLQCLTTLSPAGPNHPHEYKV